MKPSRPVLLVASTFIVLLLVGGGIIVNVSATENSYRQVILFAEVLSLVLENYVDPVDPDGLLQGAYEGMLAGLDPNGAFLSPEEVSEWKAGDSRDWVDTGFTVLKAGRALQVVAVDPGSAAEDAGVTVGDQIRAIDGRVARDLSLQQSRRFLRGRPGKVVEIDVMHPSDGFRRERIELACAKRRGRPYTISVERRIAVLRILDLRRLSVEALTTELDDVLSRGIDELLIDLRNLADGDPRDAAEFAALFASGNMLQLRDRSGRLVESLDSDREEPIWPGAVAVLVNGATAGGSEALALLIQAGRDAVVFGEETYGLGAEAKLYELENGSALLVSSALWETAAGDRWNSDGVKPNQEIQGAGETLAEVDADQLGQVLDLLEKQQDAETVERKAA